jgi:hypothetical protein
MNLNDYEAVWKRQPLPAGEQTDIAGMRKKFEGRHRLMTVSLLVRDWLEIAVCGVMVATYLWFWYKAGRAGWPLGVAILLVLGVAVLFLRERRRARRNRPGVDASLRSKVEADLAELHHQRWLLLKVWLWYIAPFAVAMLLHVSVIMRAKSWDPVLGPLTLGLACLFIALACGGTWAINRVSVRKWIEPQIAELEKLQRELTEAGG